MNFAQSCQLFFGDYTNYIQMIKRDTKFGTFFFSVFFRIDLHQKGYIFLEVFYMDANQGNSYEAWDIILTDEQALLQLLIQVAANNTVNFQAVFIIPAQVLHMYLNVLKLANYQDIDVVYWMLTTTNRGKNSPPQERFIPATVTIVLARSPNKHFGSVRAPLFDRNGNFRTEKFNFFLGPDESRKHIDLDRNIINVDQRPPWLASHLVKPYVKMSETALVFGAGVGGDVAGLLNLGLNVIAIEQELKQFAILKMKFMTYKPVPELYKAATMLTVELGLGDVLTEKYYKDFHNPAQEDDEGDESEDEDTPLVASIREEKPQNQNPVPDISHFL